MTPSLQHLRTPTGQLIVVGVLAACAAAWTAWQRLQRPRPVVGAPAATVTAAPSLPKIFQRTGARLELPASAPRDPATMVPAEPIKIAPPVVLPLAITVPSPKQKSDAPSFVAPYGRLIACETVIALESSRLDTPIVGLVTESVWSEGRCVVPAGTEVHGRVTIDHVRERLAASGPWVFVSRAPGPDSGRELKVQGIALDREAHAQPEGAFDRDGSAGLRGELVRTDDFREVKLFAATFLASATAALQDTRASSGVLGESLIPAATARNASLAGSSAILREYAQQIREAIARDGFYLRIPAGKAFYLYVTQSLEFHETR